MKTSKNLIVIGTIAFALMTTDALAEKCNGYVVSKASESVLLRKADDGSKVLWVSSEGYGIVINPANHPANQVTRICGGGFRIAPDGKSGSGMGACSYTDRDADVYHLAWEGNFTEGTWKVVGGTGKFEKYSANGTFTLTKRFDNGWGDARWEGECSFAQ